MSNFSKRRPLLNRIIEPTVNTIKKIFVNKCPNKGGKKTSNCFTLSSCESYVLKTYIHAMK